MEDLPSELNGAQVRDAFIAASAHLDAVAASIDAINVYPVPDGDTGSNMAGTVRGAIAGLDELPDEVGVGEVVTLVAKAALYSARGNSGVILSQALWGMARSISETERVDGAMLAEAFSAAATAAYSAVAEPLEGTMLTVLRAAGEGAADGRLDDVTAVFARAVEASERAAAKTIDQMEILREAGVTDAGGEGICALFRGMLAFLDGSTPAARAFPAMRIAIQPDHEIETFGFCTEFVLESIGDGVDEAAVRGMALEAGGRSLVTLGGEEALRVHVHVDNPRALLDAVGALGTVVQPKFDDMAAQHRRLQEMGSGTGARVAVLALCQGDGFHAIFEDLGVHTLDLGVTSKASAGEIATAADAIGTPVVIVLPDHANALFAAEQSVSLARAEVHVVPTRSMPEGVEAAIAFEPASSTATIVGALTRASQSATTIEVSQADATRTVSGVSVSAGGWIAIVDGELVAARTTIDAVVVAGLEAAGAGTAELATIYTGASLSDEQRRAIQGSIETAFSELEVETVEGGQAIYHVIVALE